MAARFDGPTLVRTIQTIHRSHMPEPLDSDIWTCSICELQHHPIDLKHGEKARCTRCNSPLTVRPRTGPGLGMIWSVAALIMFSISATQPILEVSKLGAQHQAGLMVAEKGFTQTGMMLLGSLSGIFVFWLPILVAFSLSLINLATLRNYQSPLWYTLLKTILFARKWAMPEVFLLAVMVAFIKVGDLAETQAKPGLWFLLAGTLFLLAAIQRIDRDNLEKRFKLPETRHELKSHKLSFALLLSALILLIPANLLPILEMRLPANHNPQTIIGGVQLLLQHNMLGIAIVVFTASILVPFAKLAGLAWLLWAARQGQGSLNAMKLYDLLEKVGRWSMLDVFLVALLAGLIHFGQMAEIRPGAATPVFAAAVILTALAVDQFDTRRLWKPFPQS